MILLLLAGLWALVAGRISVAPSLTFSGRQARIYGLLLIVGAFLIPDISNSVLIRILSPSLLKNHHTAWSLLTLFVLITYAFSAAVACIRLSGEKKVTASATIYKQTVWQIPGLLLVMAGILYSFSSIPKIIVYGILDVKIPFTFWNLSHNQQVQLGWCLAKLLIGVLVVWTGIALRRYARQSV